MTQIATFPAYRSAWLKDETNPALGRSEVVLASGAGVVRHGTLLAKITLGAATAAALVGNAVDTGALTLDATTPVLADAKAGVYKVRCIEPATNGGVFSVVGPEGYMLGRVAVGETWAAGVKFTIADGTTDFSAGEGFDVTVAAGVGEYVPCDLTGLDGRATPAGFLYSDGNTDARTESKRVVIVDRDAGVAMNAVVFHDSFDSDAKKLAAFEALAAKGFKRVDAY